MTFFSRSAPGFYYPVSLSGMIKTYFGMPLRIREVSLGKQLHSGTSVQNPAVYFNREQEI